MKRLLEKYPLLFLILPVAAFIRIYKLGEKQLWMDEITQVTDASPNSLRQILLGVKSEVAAAPLDFIVQHVFIAGLGRSEFAVRLHAAVFGILAVVVFYYLTKQMLGPSVAQIAALLYAVYPLHHHYSQESRPYALFVFLTLCSYLAFWQLLFSPNRRTRDGFYYTAVNLLLLYTNYYGFFVMLSQCLFLLCSIALPRVQASFLPVRKIDLTLGLKCLTSVTVATALFIPWIIFALTGTRGHTPEHFGGKLLLRLIKELSDGSYPLSFILIFLAVLGMLRLKSEQKYGHLIFLLLWLLLPLPLILALIRLRNYFFAIRQILFTTPALFILVAYGIGYLAEIGARSRKAPAGKTTVWITAGVVLISVGVILIHIPDQREDLKAAAQFLRQNTSRGDMIFTPGLVGILHYYFPDIYAYYQEIDLLPSRKDRLGAGQKIYVVQSKHLSASDQRIVNAVCRPPTNQRTVDLRGLQIIEIAAPPK